MFEEKIPKTLYKGLKPLSLMILCLFVFQNFREENRILRTLYYNSLVLSTGIPNACYLPKNQTWHMKYPHPSYKITPASEYAHCWRWSKALRHRYLRSYPTIDPKGLLQFRENFERRDVYILSPSIGVGE